MAKTKTKAKVKKTTKSTTRKKTSRKPTKPKTKKTKKKLVKKVAKKSASKSLPVRKTQSSEMLNLKKFLGNKTNVIKLLILLVAIGVVSLFKDVLVVATVNGAPIYRWSVITRLEEQGGRQILDSLVTEKLVNQAVKKSGVVVEQDVIDTNLLDIESSLTAQGMTLDQALEEQGMTKAELIEDIVLQKSVELAVAEGVEVTDEEIDAYIEENKEFFPEGTNPNAIREGVREQLKSQALNEKIQAWVQSLQDEASVIYLREYERSGL